MKMERMQCFETSAYKIQTPGNYPEDNILYPQHGESLKTVESYEPEESSRFLFNVSILQSETPLFDF
jgi:hypothetical protein